MKLGFVGTGTISSAVIAGLAKSSLDIEEVIVSPRNAETAARLSEQHALVSVGKDNQDVVDRSQIVFLAVRPQIAEAVIRDIHFRSGQHVVSFIPVVSPETIAGWIGVPVKITQALPLPFVAHRLGATAFYPPEETISAIFSALGTAVAVTDRREYELLTTGSALMGTYFGILESAERWLTESGVPSLQAHAYLRQLFTGLAYATAVSPNAAFAELRSEFSTKGGLNEQIFRDFQGSGGTAALEGALAGALARVRGG
ncbi:pyrroline-5-carboxylate reductase [Bosea sp. F3-2]|uniref:pyrroline-5-carboxylate reductase n=1 Tax=Bosea sp. F3-2 TaxID=2599640 RepID=UPI0011EFAA2E|nr:pyrroline-5-carboxylate reductase [Bosea sp. F3-2]QEL22994.1 pyrroline-5-carboxylate reductase [Bosea sp. F3-2]